MPASAPLPHDPIDLAKAHWRAAGWEDSTDGMALITSIMRTQQVFLARVETVLRPRGLTFARYEVLMLLRFSRTGVLPIGKVGERLQVHPASVTNAVQRLELDGFVKRSTNPADARSVLVTITAKGRAATERVTKQLNADVFSIVPGTAKDQQDVYKKLKSMRRAFGDFK